MGVFFSGAESKAKGMAVRHSLRMESEMQNGKILR